MEVQLEKWHRCNIDKEVLKKLLVKSDLKGFQHISVYFGLLIITGYLSYLTWGTFWGIFWIFPLKMFTN